MKKQKNFKDFENGLLKIMGANCESKFYYARAALEHIESAPEEFQDELFKILITKHDAIPESGMKIETSPFASETWKEWTGRPEFPEKVKAFCENIWERNITAEEMAREVRNRLQGKKKEKMSKDEKTMFLALILYGKESLANYVHIKDRLTDEEFDDLAKKMQTELQMIHLIVSNRRIRTWSDTGSVILEKIEKEPDKKKKIALLTQALRCANRCLGSGGVSEINIIGMGGKVPKSLLLPLILSNVLSDITKKEG